MLISAVACIDYGYGRHFAGILGCPFKVVPHDDDVGIVRHHHNRVLQGFSFRSARHFGVGKANHLRAEPISGCLEAKAGASARLEEQSGNYPSLEKAAIRVLLKLLRHPDEVLYLFARVIGYGYKASVFHRFVVFLCKDKKKIRD